MHRKIIEVTVRLVVDVDNSEFSGDETSTKYSEQMDEAVERQIDAVVADIEDKVYSAQLKCWDFTN